MKLNLDDYTQPTMSVFLYNNHEHEKYQGSFYLVSITTVGRPTLIA
jgi:hypothetical protein